MSHKQSKQSGISSQNDEVGDADLDAISGGQSDMPIQKMDTIVVTAKRMPKAKMDTIVVTATRLPSDSQFATANTKNKKIS